MEDDKHIVRGLIEEHPRAWTKILKANHGDIYSKIDSFVKNLSFSGKSWLWFNNIEEIPSCKGCGGKVRFKNIRDGFSAYCSNICAGNDDSVKNTRRKTCLERFGCSDFTRTERFKNEFERTCLEKYGDTHFGRNKEVRDKTKKLVWKGTARLRH